MASPFHIVVAYNLMHFAEAASVLLARNQIEERVHLVLIGPDQQKSLILRAARYVLPDMTTEESPPGFASSVLTRIDIRDTRVPDWIYNACGPDTSVVIYGTDTMAHYPVADNAYFSRRVTDRFACPPGIGGSHINASGNVQAIDRQSLGKIVRVISATLGDKKIATPKRPYVLMTLQYPEYFLRERGLTPELLDAFFTESVRVCQEKGYDVLIKPHYRLQSVGSGVSQSTDVVVQDQLLDWPSEFSHLILRTPPAAVVGHWSTSLWTLPFVHDVPAFTHMLPTYFRYLEDWTDKAGTKFALLLHHFNSPPLADLPHVQERFRIKEVYESWIARGRQSPDTPALLKVAYHLKFESPDLATFTTLRPHAVEGRFPSGFFNAAERQALQLWHDGEFGAFSVARRLTKAGVS